MPSHPTKAMRKRNAAWSRDWQGKAAGTLEAGLLAETRLCPECGIEFRMYRPKHRFCSARCKNQLHNRLRREAFDHWRKARE